LASTCRANRFEYVWPIVFLRVFAKIFYVSRHACRGFRGVGLKPVMI
jgi:hypothetical protein